MRSRLKYLYWLLFIPFIMKARSRVLFVLILWPYAADLQQHVGIWVTPLGPLGETPSPGAESQTPRKNVIEKLIKRDGHYPF